MTSCEGRAIAAIARFATTLRQAQRRRLGLPLKKGTRAFRKGPGYDVFYQVLTRMDPEAFAAQLVESLPALEGKLITADPLHCQRSLARSSVDKGGDYLFQVKGNQPNLLRQAQGLDAMPATPFSSKPKPAMDASKSTGSIPSPSNP